MIDLFDLKKGEAKYYDKPQKFYVVMFFGYKVNITEVLELLIGF